MDRKELLKLIEEKTDDVFLKYQEKNDIKSGDISPEQALRLEELQNELADLVMHVGSRQEEQNGFRRLPDMRKVWINQINLLRAVADDIIKIGPIPELCRYLTHEYPFILTEWPCNGDGSVRASVSDRVRLNYGEAYAYIHLNEGLRPTGEVTWNTEEMGVSDEVSSDAEMTKVELKAMPEKQARAMAECIDEGCYGAKDEMPVEYRSFAETMNS